MEDLVVDVNDSNYVQTNVINNIRIRVNNLILFKSVSIMVNLLNNKKLINNVYFTLEGTDYTNWANDDTYIVTYVLEKLNLTKVTTVTTE
jgi:hypothetical protein